MKMKGQNDMVELTEEELEKSKVNTVKILLNGNVPFEDITIITGKSTEDIKRIGGITD
ncbi:MAG: hypothetical protein PUD25_02600 [Bacilli bacterium]|nr:hypothetical protein [Bacilli bacterium]